MMFLRQLLLFLNLSLSFAFARSYIRHRADNKDSDPASHAENAPSHPRPDSRRTDSIHIHH